MRRNLLALALAPALAACGGSGASTSTPGTTVAMQFDRPAFFDAPFPSDDLVAADGTVRLDAFPNPSARPMVADTVKLLEESAHGFSLAGGIFFQLDGAIDTTRLPSLADSVADDATVFVLGASPDAPDYLRRYPVETSFDPDESVYGPANLLTLLPLQGVPLRPRATYAAVVLRSLNNAQGEPLGQSAAMRALAAGSRPDGLSDGAWTSYQRALAALSAAGVSASDVAGLAAFTTDDPTAGLAKFRAHVIAQAPPAPAQPFAADEVFDDYCVFSSTIEMPVYQRGTPPYLTSGGDWGTDEAGNPLLDHTELANLVVTVPRRAQPPAGMPVMIFVRTGGGGDRPLVDRGRHDASGAAVEAGEGPARYFARAGFAGVSVDGPMSGRRYAGVDEQYVLFNVQNGRALRDSIRQSALELDLLAHVLPGLSIDVSSCPGGPGTLRFDPDRMGLMGHSTGAWISALVLAFEPSLRIAVLSGAGGSWINNILYKQKPLMVEPLAAAFLGEPQLVSSDPAVSLVQWAVEPADPQVYARDIVRELPPGLAARDVLMEQGLVDHYILPRIAEAVSLGMGLDLAGDAIDQGVPDQLPLTPLLPLVGARALPLPVAGNATGGATAVVRQHPGDGIEDAHEIVFQTEPPKNEYRCFLASFLSGTPRVIAGTTADAPCE